MPVPRGSTWGHPSVETVVPSLRGRVLRRECITCPELFEVRQAHAADKRRCDDCIAKGLRKCFGCDVVFKGGPLKLCENCRQGRTLKPTGTLVRLQCQGVKFFDRFEQAEGCRRTRLEHVSSARQRPRRNLDLDPRGNFYVCASCNGLKFYKRLVNAQLTKVRDRGDAPPRLRNLHDAVKFLSQEGALNLSSAGRLARISKEELRAVSMAPPRVASRRRTGTKEPRSFQHRLALRAAKWTGTRAGRPAARLCEWCGKLVLDGGNRLPTTHHQSCRFERRRAPEAKGWWAQRLDLRRQGLSIERVDKLMDGAFPPLPTEKNHRGPDRDPAKVTRNLGWTIEYLCGPTTDKVRWVKGRKVYIPAVQLGQLAHRDRVSEKTVSQAIKETMALLPDPAKTAVPKKFASLIADLRLASELRKTASR